MMEIHGNCEKDKWSIEVGWYITLGKHNANVSGLNFGD